MGPATIGHQSWFDSRAVMSSVHDRWNCTQRIRTSGDDVGTKNMRSIDRNTIDMNQEHDI